MKLLVWGILIVALATSAAGSDLESSLSPDRPQDRAILGYLALAQAKTATAADLTELGVLLADTHRLGDAEHWLQQAVKADKHSFAAWYRLGLVQQQLGRSHDAAKTLARALRERPDDAYARFMLAVAEERCGSSSAAIADYVRAYRLQPELADPMRNPLVLDSELQVEANLAYYKETVAARTMPVAPLDPAAVKAMMEAKPTPTPAPAPAAADAAAAQPLPPAETIPAPAPAAAVAPPAATPRPTPRPGAPGAPAPSGAPSL